jgi:hypothetical protein
MINRIRPFFLERKKLLKGTNMNIEELAKEAHKVWFEYGEVIKEKFGFPKDSHIVAGPLLEAIKGGDEQQIRNFIIWVKQQIEDLRKM